MSVIALTPLDLSIAAALVLLLAITSARMRLGVSRQLLISAVRTAVQLALLGLVLRALFAHAKPLLVLAMAIVMLLAAAREVFARQERRFRGLWGFGIGTSSMFVSAFTVTILALLAIVGPEPWYTPQYAIPLLGMVLGNTMNGIALSLERLLQSTWQQRAVIEQRLMLGQTRGEAIADVRRDSMRAGLTPIINAMAAAGLVALPGMMTGQILAGSPPIEAAKYQILIMFLIAGGTGFGAVGAIWIATYRLFDRRHRLRLERLRGRTA
jgi:putative ABC transport system permease protein